MLMHWLEQIPYPLLIAAALLLGLAPFIPEPHVIEKIRLLTRGDLNRPLDIFDLFFHLFPVLLLIVKLVRQAAKKITR